jgi:hypothetical protein
MSFDLDLVSFKDGGPLPFPVDIVTDALGPFIRSRDKDGLCQLAFPDGGSGELLAFDENETEISDISIGEASGTDIYDALYEILSRTHSALIWSFGGCAVADASVIPDLPDELIEELGQPVVVKSGAEIAAAVAET